MILAAFICFSGISISSFAQTDSLLPAREMTVRAGLPNFYKKLKAGKPVKIAFLGGSITRAGNGYRDQLLKSIREQNPSNTITEIMAAVSGTGSDFGACRVDDHVIRHHPDLLFVEFAVNDNKMLMKLVRETMEGIVRKTWKANAATDICFIYTFSSENLSTLQKGLFPPSVSAMEAVAGHYGIPSIHMGLTVVDEISKGRMLIMGKKDETDSRPLFSYDGVHPLPETGHRVYTSVLLKNLGRLATSGKAGKHRLRIPLEAKNWSDAGMLSLGKNVQFSGHWATTDSVTKGKEYYSLLPQVYVTNDTNAVIIATFNGTRFGMADIMGPGTAAVEITIDNQPPKIIDRFDAFSTYYRLNFFIIPGLSPGKHTAKIRLVKGRLNKAGILKTRNNNIKDWSPYKNEVLYAGALLY
ncbi:hypothetical protein SAMN04487894_11399 [Niabella drilacis]|uniref:Lysophospholipase L1 n=2 Tax=Niabella drilacis (strain DSM 25811 / CCM 8410 / CCUG 62505 / LMG 26954 / E90) TaxID=1285928 RepID=A0A1G6XJT9_NIADE|nr:hypothetical protein SAMN04487894_11399 [Niabella drilacis]